MRGLSRLMWREWRDVRSVAGGCAILAVVATLLTQHFIFEYSEPAWTARYLVPLVTAVYVLIAASDLVAGDLRTRRIDALALLPAGAGTVWLAKAAFLAISGTLFCLFAVGVQLAVLAMAGGGGAYDLFVELDQCLAPLGWVAAAGAAAALFSTLGRPRGRRTDLPPRCRSRPPGCSRGHGDRRRSRRDRHLCLGPGARPGQTRGPRADGGGGSRVSAGTRPTQPLVNRV